jgi:hypothetical protein
MSYRHACTMIREHERGAQYRLVLYGEQGKGAATHSSLPKNVLAANPGGALNPSGGTTLELNAGQQPGNFHGSRGEV